MNQPQIEKIDKHESKAVGVVMFFIIIWVVISILLDYKTELGKVKSLLLGLGVWSAIYFFMLFKHFWIFPAANYSVVLQDYVRTSLPFLSDEQEKEVDELRIPAGQRACPTGPNAKWPWELPVGEAVHMGRAKIVEDSMIVLDKRGREFTITYQAQLTPVPGRFLPRFLFVESEVAERYFKGVFADFVITEFKKLDGEEVMATMDDEHGFRTRFKECLGGPRTIDNKERSQGRYTGAPFITSIRMEQGAQKASQLSKVADQTAEAVERLVASGVAPNVAAAMAAKLQGIDSDLIVVNAEGMGRGNREITVGDLMDRLNDKSKKHNRGK
jgi:hypothetical protein